MPAFLNSVTSTQRLFKWAFYSAIIGALSGSASAFFLIALEFVTQLREANRWLIYLLPVGGFLIGLMYHSYGRGTDAGSNLIIDEIHEPKKMIPLRLAPFVLLGTLATHLFGGSAGREGTAVQMGGALADQINKIFKLDTETRRILLMAGMSGGFASVFGTPVAGAVFGLEVLLIGSVRYDAIFPCFVAAFIGHLTTLEWGVTHSLFTLGTVPVMTFTGAGWSFLAGALFGILGFLFSESTHTVAALAKAKIKYAPLRPLVGGVLVAGLVLAFGLWRFIGLGVPVIQEALHGPVSSTDFVYKFILTVITLGFGFKGGEVTPLFFIGATFGSALALFIPLPAGLLAGMGFVAVFGGAANVPLASTFMAIELFGGQAGAFVAIACVGSYLFSGQRGIYRSQRSTTAKY